MVDIKNCPEKHTGTLVELCEAPISGDEGRLSRKTETLGGSLKNRNTALNLALKADQYQWQPIETAPRDGSYLLMTNGKEVQKGFFATDSKRVYSESHVGGWTVEELIYNYDATHWMPLPPLPQ